MSVTPWTLQSVEFSRPEYWSGWPFHSPEGLPNPGTEPRSPTLQVDSLPAEPQGKPTYVKVKESESHSVVSVTPWTTQSMEFSRPEYWSGWPFPSPGDLPNPGIEPRSPISQADSLPVEPQGKPRH